MENHMRSLPPENLRWIRGKLIGKGSFGSVSVGFDRVKGRVFAVKSVAVNSASAAQLDAIENEIRVLRSLSSPYIVEYYGDDTTKAAPEISYRNLHMEYLSGGTAADSAGADEELLRRYTRCIASALKFAHSRGIIHCDVKGRNVLLGPAPGAAKLADFGSAKREGDDRRDGFSPRGSPLWMAPEVVRGESQDYESDVWALGCTLIEMVTGAPAWRDEGADTLRRIGYSDESPRFPTRLSELGRDFLDKCLRRHPAQRWSCDQLLQHPFLKVESTVQIEASPRSVFEWPRLPESDDEDVEESGGAWDSNALERVGKLAAEAGANWESDGWAAVRGGGNEGAGTSSEYSELLGVKVEFGCIAPARAGCSGGFGGGDRAALEESEPFSFTTVKEDTRVKSEELLYLMLSILYCTNYISNCNDTSNESSFVFYTSSHFHFYNPRNCCFFYKKNKN